jgi:hypothetical protein
MVQNILFKVAEVNLVYSPNYKIADRPKIKTADEAYQLLMGSVGERMNRALRGV